MYCLPAYLLNVSLAGFLCQPSYSIVLVLLLSTKHTFSKDLHIQKGLKNMTWGDVSRGVRFGKDIWNEEG